MIEAVIGIAGAALALICLHLLSCVLEYWLTRNDSEPTHAESRVLDVTRPSVWLPTILSVLCLSGCGSCCNTQPCRVSCMPLHPVWIEPPRETCDLTHPILREDRQTLPGSEHRGFIRDSPPSSDK